MKYDMKQSSRTIAFTICIIIFIALLTLAVPSVSYAVSAADSQPKKVRVAYVQSPGYQEGGEGEYKTGYGYEYLQKIAQTADWKYEYVYGSFNDLLEKLESGEVDIMGNLSYTDERAQYISYGSYEEGKENYYLYIKQSNKEISAQDYSSLNGKRIGVNAGTYQEQVWKEWCSNHKVNCKIVEFTSIDARYEALNNGEIDATVASIVQQDRTTSDWKVVMTFGTSPFYFGVNKNRADLLSELNEAQKSILEDNPFYNEEIYDRYMKSSSLTTTNLDAEERQWLKDNDSTVTVGYLEGFQPISYTDDHGDFRGSAADVLYSMEELYKKADFKVQAIPYQDYETMIAALRLGDINAAWPVYMDYWNADQYGLALTNKAMSASMMMVFKGDYTEDTASRIGVVKSGALAKVYAEIYYRDSEVVEFDNYDDAVEALSRGSVNSVLYETSVFQVNETTSDILPRLSTVTLQQPFSISFATDPTNRALVSILNKGILAFGDSGANRSLLTNSVVDRKITVREFMRLNPLASNVIIGSLILVLAGIVIFVVYNNMSVRVKTTQAEKDIFERLSNSDPLTELYNRKAVFNRCRQLMIEHPDETFAMVHIDMKHFKLYNTFFGDEVGDKLLRDIAGVLRRLAKDYQYCAYGRIEADVFCAFVPYEEDKYKRHIAEATELLKNYRQDFLIEPKFGVYIVSNHEMSIEGMFSRATMASKGVQPNTPYSTVVYDEKLEREISDKQQVINEMKTAIDEEQFEVYLQPKYSLDNAALVGAEALVRWNHPDRGMISPSKFIPVFESNGFITELDRYMWEHVCILLAKWQKEGKPNIPVSVNISRLSMYGTSTVNYLKYLVNKYDIEPRCLELELTESAYMDNPEEMKKQLLALKEAGFVILLDDFGSGYSSLNTLREMPVDILKLDMKFMSMETGDTRGKLVVSSIVRMSKLLNLEVIAEGVELQEQADFLRSIGCEYVQGYLFARPMPAAEYEARLAEV